MTSEPLKDIDSGIGSTLGDYKFLYGLVSMLNPHYIAEVGTNCGGSTIAMAMALRDGEVTAPKIFSVDVNGEAIKIADEQLRRLGLRQYVVLMHGDSKLLQRGSYFDMSFIDGGHSYEDCLTDFERLEPVSGYIVFHDSKMDGPARLIRELSKTYEVFDFSYGRLGKQWSKGNVVYNSFPGIAIVKVKKNG